MLNFSAITNNDIPIQSLIRNRSDSSLIDLTGYTIKVELFNLDGSIISTYTTGDNTVIIPNQTTNKGAFQFKILRTQTVDLVTGTYKWEPTITSPIGNVYTVSNPDMLLSPGQIIFRKQLTVP